MMGGDVLQLTPREEMLWLAALLDGEGCFSSPGNYPRINLGMTDEDTVRTAHRRAGVGKVTGPYLPKEDHHKPMWRWRVSESEHVFELCRLLYPYMSLRRQKRIESILSLSSPKTDPIWLRVERWER